MRASRGVLVLALALACAPAVAAAGAVGKFYHPNAFPSGPYVAAPLKPPAKPQVATARTRTTEDEVVAMFADGYEVIGYSAFVGPPAKNSQIAAHGKKVGAALVSVLTQYAGTISGAMPMTMPNNQTSVTMGSANLSGPRGPASGTFSSTTTTYGNQTMMVPFSSDRYDQMILFFAEVERRGYGIGVRPVDDDQARALGTARALSVAAVRRGSPGFNADILPGDIVRSVDGQPVQPDRWRTMAAWGARHTFVMLRGEREFSVQMEVAPGGEWLN